MKRALLAVALAVAALAALLVARAVAPADPAVPALDVPATPFDAAPLADALGAALRCRTVALGDPPLADPAAFACLHAVLAAAFPHLHDEARVTRTAFGASLLYEWRGSDASLPPILLLAHQDVVPANEGAAAAWTHDAFSGARVDGHVWGRGALDDKGPLVTLLAGLERLLAEGHVPRRTVLVALGHDEETGGSGGAQAIAAHLAARGVRAAFALDEGIVITSGIVPGVAPPVALVGVAEKGYLTIRLTAKRTPGHSSMPGPDTAIAALARALVALDAEPIETRVDGIAARQFRDVAPHLPFGQRLAVRNLWLLEPAVRAELGRLPAAAAQLRTTQAVTVVDGGVRENVLPTEATATVNYRVHPRDTVDGIVARARRLAAPFGVVVEATRGSGASPVSAMDGDAYDAIAGAIRAVRPEAVVAPSLVTGATDGRHYAGVAENVYRFAPMELGKDDVERLHGIDERIAEEQLPRMAAFYYVLVRETSSR